MLKFTSKRKPNSASTSTVAVASRKPFQAMRRRVAASALAVSFRKAGMILSGPTISSRIGTRPRIDPDPP
jgi:hypothetical protein